MKLMSVAGSGLKGSPSLRGQEMLSPGSRTLMVYSPGGSSYCLVRSMGLLVQVCAGSDQETTSVHTGGL